MVGRRCGGVAVAGSVEVDVARWSHCIVYKYLGTAFYPLTSSAGRLHVMSITYHQDTEPVDRAAIAQCQSPVQWQMQQSVLTELSMTPCIYKAAVLTTLSKNPLNLAAVLTALSKTPRI